MLRTVLISALLFITLQMNVIAQTLLAINGDFSRGTLIVNNVSFTKKSTIEDYEKVLGKAERVEKVAGEDKIFVYDKLGISLNLKANTNIVQEVYITYIYDGDKKVAKEPFKGTLAINGNKITDKSTHEELAKNSGLQLIMAMKGMYMGKGKNLSLGVYYPGETIGQFAFTF